MKIIILVIMLAFNLTGYVKGCDSELSNKNFTNWNFNDVHWLSLSGKTICNSSFYNENTDSAIFPSTMTGVTFKGCNLDNVVIPEGNILIESSNRRFKIQNDLEDWVIDKNNLPIEPLNKQYYIDLGLSTDPVDIPDEPLKEPATITRIKKNGLQTELIRKQKEIEAINDEISKIEVIEVIDVEIP